MSEQEIIEGNKLIAEFMGGENHPPLVPYIPEPDDMWFSVGNYPEERHPDNSSMWKLHELKYHSSWDWLMPVVEKIGDTYIDEMQLGTEISGAKGLYSCVISGTHIYCDNEDQKLAVWNCVVKFIKWYIHEKEN